MYCIIWEDSFQSSILSTDCAFVVYGFFLLNGLGYHLLVLNPGQKNLPLRQRARHFFYVAFKFSKFSPNLWGNM